MLSKLREFYLSITRLMYRTKLDCVPSLVIHQQSASCLLFNIT